MSKKLIACFSATGVTMTIAKEIANQVKGDLFEIIPSKLYTTEDLDWTNENSRSSVEMKNLGFRPQIENKVNNMDKYDVIYLGYPIWWGLAPTIINTFLESYDLSGKTIITFATSGGSSIGSSTVKLKSSALNSKFIEGTILKTPSDVVGFIQNIEL